MRRYLKKRILSLLNSMEEAHKALKKEFYNKNFDVVTQLLMDSQEGAAQIAIIIEQEEKKVTKTVLMLEEYCEIISEINQKVISEVDIVKSTKRLQKQIYKVINSIRYDIEDEKLEVVFLPYKSSMWDSLESIWMAVRDDPNCRAYVIPIPYYDKNPDGSFGQMHYEGTEFPEYVPITDWKEYDIKKRHPDIIYYHNPYDDSNSLTSIHPEYYSKELRNYTELLVYSPYFISGMYRTEDIFFNKIVLPGTIYADKIIVQSKVQYDLYLKCGFKAEKLLLYGSPKMDAYVNLRKENVKIPIEWLEKIGDSKVIILNSSIGNMLTNNRYLENLELILEKLSSQKGIVLLWRPHPLLKSTILSMRSHWIDKYEDIEQRIMKKNNVILDTKPDNRIATTISDGLISDLSSWTRQYLATGKPVLYIYGSRKYFDGCIPTFDDRVAYFIQDGMSIDKFCQRIIEDKDEEKEIRLNTLHALLENMDGTCGEKVHNLIMREMK